jgi:hypothetical protein
MPYLTFYLRNDSFLNCLSHVASKERILTERGRKQSWTVSDTAPRISVRSVLFIMRPKRMVEVGAWRRPHEDLH